MTCIKCKKEIEDGSIYCRFCGKKQTETPKPKALKRANGTGTITKLPGRRKKPWCVRVTIESNGVRKRVVAGCYERKTDALIELERINNLGGLPEFHNITVSAARELWMEKHYDSLSESGRTNYNTAWGHFPDHIKKMKLSEIKAYHIQSVIDAAVNKGLSCSSCQKIKQLASQLCQWAMQNDVIDKNYAQFVEINAPASTPREPFTGEELNKIWAYYKKSSDITAGIILLLCHTGLRMDELLSMKKTDYFNGCLHGGSKTEKGMNRSVPVPDVMLPIIDAMLAEKGDYIVSNSCGEKFDPKNWRNRRYYKALEAAGFTEEIIKRRTPHSCRHTYATLCARQKMDEKALQDILGHEDITTTKNIYTHTDEEYLKSAAKDLCFIDVKACGW